MKAFEDAYVSSSEDENSGQSASSSSDDEETEDISNDSKDKVKHQIYMAISGNFPRAN